MKIIIYLNILNILNIFLITGRGYTEGVDSYVLLLDISNNDEYTLFEPSPSDSPSSSAPSSPNSSSTIITTQPSTSPSLVSKPNGTIAIVGAAIGSIAGTVLLTTGSFILYKRYKKRSTLKDNHLRIQGGSATYYQNQQAPLSQLQPIYNHGQPNLMQNNIRQTPQYYGQVNNYNV